LRIATQNDPGLWAKVQEALQRSGLGFKTARQPTGNMSTNMPMPDDSQNPRYGPGGI